MTESFLLAHPAFSGLPGALLAELVARIPARTYRKGEPIFEEGVAPDAVHLLQTGLVKAVKCSATSQYASMEIVVPGQFFGMIAVMDGKPYPVSAVPLGPARAYRIPAKLFRSLMSEQPLFSERIYARIGDHLRQSQAFRALSSETVDRRVAHALCVLSASMGAVLPVRREDVAEIAGCSSETAIRTLADFRDGGLISTGWKRITIIDRRRLSAIFELE